MSTILPLTYFGSIGYFQQLLQPNAVIDIHEHYVKQTERSRCEILSANGRIPLSLPVSKPNGSKTAMKDMLISYASDWQRIHWRAIKSAYASSAFYEDYAPEIEELIFSGETELMKFNLNSIHLVNKWLDLNLKYNLSTEYVEESGTIDFRKESFDIQPVAPYYQLFSEPQQFESGLSIIDLIFAEGPMARKWFYS